MHVRNMTSPTTGRAIPNQFVITHVEHNPNGEDVCIESFQSYDTLIIERRFGKVSLDRISWDCSTTTGRYRNQFLGEKKAETLKKIQSGEYTLTDLN